MLFAISGGLADVMAMARANDIDPLDALSVFSKFQAGNIIHGRGPRMARGEVTPASFEVAMARKDVGLMIDRGEGSAARRDAVRRQADGRADRRRRGRHGHRRAGADAWGLRIARRACA